MNTTTKPTVYLQDDGTEIIGSGFDSIDKLLNDSTPETLACALALVTATVKDPSLGERFIQGLDGRLRQRNLDDCDPDAERHPTEKWLAFIDALNVTDRDITVEGMFERLTEQDAAYQQDQAFEAEDFARLTTQAQRWYAFLRNQGADVVGGCVDSLFPTVQVKRDALGEAYRQGEKLLDVDMTDLILAHAELEQIGLVRFSAA
jgi:hypothetical protein